jgi:hypothetical protein
MDTVRRYAMLIDGDWVETEDRFEIRSPATEELVASVAKGAASTPTGPCLRPEPCMRRAGGAGRRRPSGPPCSTR